MPENNSNVIQFPIKRSINFGSGDFKACVSIIKIDEKFNYTVDITHKPHLDQAQVTKYLFVAIKAILDQTYREIYS